MAYYCVHIKRVPLRRMKTLHMRWCIAWNESCSQEVVLIMLGIKTSNISADGGEKASIEKPLQERAFKSTE